MGWVGDALSNFVAIASGDGVKCEQLNIPCYKSAKSAPKARKRKNSANKENVFIESHRRSARSQLFSNPSFNIDRPFIEDSMSPSSSGINKKRINQTKNSNVYDASFRTPLSNVTNTSTSPTVELPKGKEKCKPPKVFKETTRNLFNEQDDDSNDLCDYEIDESVIDGVSFSDDGLFDSDDSYEEYCSTQSILVDSDTDSEDDDVNMISNNKSKNRRRSQHVMPEEYASLGSPFVKCDVMLAPTPTPPTYLMKLYNNDVKSVSFQRNIRLYNAMFSFTSTSGNIDHSINKGGGPYIYRLNGQNHHVFGSLIPDEGQTPKFCQLYIYDTANEVNNRLRWVNISHGSTVDAEVVQGLINMLDESNELVGEFRMARDRFENNYLVDLKVELKIFRSESGRENHISPSDEVAAVMVGSSSKTTPDRDIIVERKKPLDRDIIVEANKDFFQRVSYIHPKLMALQYPLLFPLGEDGYHDKIPKQSANLANLKDSDMISMKTYYSYRFQIRDNEALTPRLGGRLFQQYMVDAFSAIEQTRLWWFRINQTILRNEFYTHICDLVRKGDDNTANVGKGVILPSGFVGSKRYMQQNFQDALAVCRHVGHPDIFLTMTTNPLWDEIQKIMLCINGDFDLLEEQDYLQLQPEEIGDEIEGFGEMLVQDEGSANVNEVQ
ncbi:hypothetical protein POM88_053649 [Heracleum sosnowskyi]|uniref:Helitron helicase-like domain-containing protein n=1 Tax=Heracleum sosnowskyi TaxID=360622 RepID=A0AAD8GNL4_9APIA|nr:hypothetical protein POM88_053649 [Heracleum sosnowskyi]